MPQPFRPTALVFDLDGLIFDTEALFARVAGDMLRARGKEFTPEIMRAMIGRRAVDVGEAFRRLTGLTEPVDVLMADVKGRFFAEVDTAVRPMPGLHALLDLLEQKGLPRGVATSSRGEYARGLLASHGLIDRFAFVLSGDDVTEGKPAPEIYLKAAERLGMSPTAVLVLEDSVAGLRAAKAAGAFAVGVPHEHSPAEGLVDFADLIIGRLDDPRLFALIDAPRTLEP